jgi:cysteine desulfurase
MDRPMAQGTSSYLDHNATTPVRSEVVDAMVVTLAECGNPSSVHAAGRRARKAMEAARAALADALGAAPADIVFTSGGTEANHLALHGTGRERVLISAIEHDSVIQARPGAVIVPVTPSGVIDLAALEQLLEEQLSSDGPAIVSVMAANNETGVLQPVGEVVRLARRYGALVHCDAVQLFGKQQLDRAMLGADLISLSAHKIGGPQGVGALVIRSGTTVGAVMQGGGQERGIRPGTENVAGIVGFGVAASLATAELGTFAKLAAWRDELERRLISVDPAARAFGAEVPRLANTLCVSMPGVKAETQVMALDLAGVAVSAGSACSSGKVQRSHVLEAMGVDPETAESAIRISLGRTTIEADLDRLVEAWSALRLRTRQASRPSARSAA